MAKSLVSCFLTHGVYMANKLSVSYCDGQTDRQTAATPCVCNTVHSSVVQQIHESTTKRSSGVWAWNDGVISRDVADFVLGGVVEPVHTLSAAHAQHRNCWCQFVVVVDLRCACVVGHVSCRRRILLPVRRRHANTAGTVDVQNAFLFFFNLDTFKKLF